MHFLHVLHRVSLGGKIRFDGLVHHRNEGDDVAQGNKRSRVDSVGRVLFQAGMPQSDFVLVIEPILIVGTKACIKNPLFKAQAAFGRVVGNRSLYPRRQVDPLWAKIRLYGLIHPVQGV